MVTTCAERWRLERARSTVSAISMACSRLSDSPRRHWISPVDVVTQGQQFVVDVAREAAPSAPPVDEKGVKIARERQRVVPGSCQHVGDAWVVPEDGERLDLRWQRFDPFQRRGKRLVERLCSPRAPRVRGRHCRMHALQLGRQSRMARSCTAPRFAAWPRRNLGNCDKGWPASP